MTREELSKMVGEDNVDYAIEILLSNVKEAFVTSCIKSEIKSTESEMCQLEEEGYILTSNGTKVTSFSNVAKHQGWNQTEEQAKAEAEALEKYHNAEALIYKRNRLTHMIAIRL